jgi:hypothetical protein
MRERQILGEPHPPAGQHSPPDQSLRPGPTVTATLGLGALVLVAHAALVVDGWQMLGLRTQQDPQTKTEIAASAEGTAAAQTAAQSATAPTPPTVRVTQVRWIAADPPAVTRVKPAPPAASGPRPAIRPATPKAMPSPPPTPSPAAAVAATEPLSAETPAPATEASTPVEMAQAPAPLPELEASNATPVPLAAERPTAASLPKAAPPPSAHLDYDVQGTAKGIRYQASGELNWTVKDGRYDARMEVRMFLLGSRVQTSVGTLGPEGLRPERFADIRRGERAAHFERDSGRIRFSNNAPTVELEPGAQDRLSLFLQLAGLLQASPRREGDVIAFQVAGTGGAETWRFEVGPEEVLALPAGEIAARRVVRHPRDTYDTLVEMWFAPSAQHLPVRLRLTQANGDVADQLLRRLP